MPRLGRDDESFKHERAQEAPYFPVHEATGSGGCVLADRLRLPVEPESAEGLLHLAQRGGVSDQPLAGEEFVHMGWKISAVACATQLEQAGQRSKVDDVEDIGGPVSVDSMADDRAQQARKRERPSW